MDFVDYVLLIISNYTIVRFANVAVPSTKGVGGWEREKNERQGATCKEMRHKANT